MSSVILVGENTIFFSNRKAQKSLEIVNLQGERARLPNQFWYWTPPRS